MVSMPKLAEFSLDAKYRQEEGTVLLSGVQALVRVPLDQHRADRRRGLRTATFVSGYQGSPLGGFDLTLSRNRQLLAEHDVVHQPGLNEELGAAAVWGSQAGAASGFPYARHDGVVGVWYGKSPGVDRSGDVFKHANMMGVARNGGVLVLAGDDPSAKSSTLPNDSQAALYDAVMPVLTPGGVQDVLDLGLHGVALSRYCGSWVGVKVWTNVADGFGTAEVGPGRVAPVVPELVVDGRPWRHVQLPNVFPAVPGMEDALYHGRLEAARAYARANSLNRISAGGERAWLGVVAAGKTYHDVVQAFFDLGLDEAALRDRGVRLLKLGMTFPFDAATAQEFARGLEEVLVVEEKRPFVELFVRDALYGLAERPAVVGKRDEEGRPLVPTDNELSADRLAPVLAARLGRKGALPSSFEARLDLLADAARRAAPLPVAVAPVRVAAPSAVRGVDLEAVAELDQEGLPTAEQETGFRSPEEVAPHQAGVVKPARTPAFCSGCPHNRSTVLPVGSIGGGGIGCHGMVYFEPRHKAEPWLPAVPMGTEGALWIGLAPFVEDGHVFQNLGDGTMSHSGSLAIRACVAAGANITFKILYNAAVAMTGGQPVEGVRPVPDLARELEAEGVRRIIVCADDPGKYGRDARFPPGVEVWHRDRLDEASRALREVRGVTALVYDQRCAAEARRLRKRGKLADPPVRVVINEAVCEGCGDCSVKSNCLSVQPVDTDLGRKTQIHQSSCNKDYSCLLGDCPSFLTVVPDDSLDGRRRWWSLNASGRTAVPRPDLPALEDASANTGPRPVPVELPEPPARPADLADGFSVYMTGVGGTGVVTASQLLATAALLEGLHVGGLDQTGLSQKAGPVVSHLKISSRPLGTGAASVSVGEADCYLAFDVLVGSEEKHLAKARPGKTVAVVSTSEVPTATMTTEGVAFPAGSTLAAAINRATCKDENAFVDSAAVAEHVFSDHMAANIVLLGAAYQAGALPLSAAALEAAIAANGVAVEKNLSAFRWGRYAVVDPAAVEAATATKRLGRVDLSPSATARRRVAALLAGRSLDGPARALAEVRAAELVDYQGAALARDYLAFVERVRAKEKEVAPERTELSEAVARYLFKLSAYKDEYEVARLHLKEQLHGSLAAAFPGRPKVKYQLHPPLLRSLGLEKKVGLPEAWFDPVFKGLRAAKALRNTPLDPFGRAEVRRVERELVGEYRAALERALAGLTARSYDEAARLAALPDVVRGYEEVKLRNVERYRSDLAAALDELATAAAKEDEAAPVRA